MEQAGVTQIDDDRCDNLRWKGLYIDAPWDPSVPHSGDRNFWCAKTNTCSGPDGKPVDDYDCNETRRCYKPL